MNREDRLKVGAASAAEERPDGILMLTDNVRGFMVVPCNPNGEQAGCQFIANPHPRVIVTGGALFPGRMANPKGQSRKKMR